MKLKAILAAGALALAASSAHAGVTFYQYGAGAPAATLVDNFSGDTLYAAPASSSSYTWSNNFPTSHVTIGSLTGYFAAPATGASTVDNGIYLTVGAGGAETLTLSKPVTGLEIYVGSLSSNNMISFSDGEIFTGSALEAISGAALDDSNAQHSPQTNGVFSFTFSKAVTSVTFNDYGQNAFEIASISSVPEPATWAMMLAGLFGIGAAIRFGRRNAAAATA